jgi:membrane protein YdbS with pleckstrin-like domain
MHCPQCGAEVVDGAKFCHRCAAPLDGSAAPPPVSSGAATATTRVMGPRATIADEAETTLWEGDFSPKTMIGDFIGAGIVTVALVIGSFYAAPWEWYVLAVIPIVWLAVLLKLAIHKLGVHYRLTSQRLFHEKGVLSRTTNRVETIDIDDVTVEQGPIERMLGVGTVRVTSSDRTDPELVIRGIEDPRTVSALIDKARRAERVKRGIHIEAV